MENLSQIKYKQDSEKPKQLVSKNGGISLEDNRPQSTIQKKANNTGLPNQLKSGIENLSGHSMDDVKVHYNSSKPAQLNAHAYAQGTDIHLASGQEKHLPHEAWHIVQQKQGRVKPTMQLKAKVNINDDNSLEKEADVMGARALLSSQKKEKNTFRKMGFNTITKTQTILKKPTQILAPIQRKILVGSNWVVHYDDNVVAQIYSDVRPYIAQWDQMKVIFKKMKKTETDQAIKDYLDQELENNIRALLRKYNENKAFIDDADLIRQVVQDIKLKLLGLENIVGIDNLDGQFSEKADDSNVGRRGKSKKLKIYRTMKMEDWERYKLSNDPKDILHGHGGSLGQALHYFIKSKSENLDDVLVEFEFSQNAANLIDYTKIQKGGEGKGPKDNKLTGKSEKNDVMALDADIFSVNLSKSHDLITELNPKITLIDKVR